MPTILIKKSDAPGSIPTTANITNTSGGTELAVNTADKRVYTVNSSGAVVELGTNPSSLTLGSPLPVASGGTGLSSTPTNGQIDIGNGTGFTRSTITAGTGITVTNATGSITIATSGGGGAQDYIVQSYGIT